MVKKPPKKKEDHVDLEVESWQWETSSRRLTWKHWIVIASLLGVAVLFAFGFLIIAAAVLFIALLVNIVLFVLKKIT
jgi:hypothetical protein